LSLFKNALFLTSTSILIFGLHYPEPQSTGAGVRMMQLISMLQANNFDIHFVTTSPKGEFSSDISSLGLKTYKIALNDSSTDILLKSVKPDVVIFDRFITEEQFGWKVDSLCPEALKILDTEDLHFLREERESEIRGKSIDNQLSNKAKRELAAMYRCDLNLIISTYEFRLLVEHYNFPKHLLFYIPLLVEDNSIHYSHEFKSKNHFVSIGNFKHKPNLDMVLFTYKHIWPLLRKYLPKAEWHIYGAYLPVSVAQLHSKAKGVIVKGRAEDAVKTLSNYSIMLAYLRFGAGLKQKCIDAMAAGTPICTTVIGAEGLSEDKNWPGIIEDSIDVFANKTIKLYQNTALLEKHQAIGFQILKDKFSRHLFENEFISKIHSTFKSLSEMRAKNITGQILKHHTLQSTKYMSLWIEEKNKAQH